MLRNADYAMQTWNLLLRNSLCPKQNSINLWTLQKEKRNLQWDLTVKHGTIP